MNMLRLTNVAIVNGSARNVAAVSPSQYVNTNLTNDEQQPLLMPDESNPKDSDKKHDNIITQTIGEYGRWQFQFTFLLSLFNIPCTFHIFGPTFQAAEQETWCARPDNFSEMPPQEWINLTQPDGYCSILNTTLNSLNESRKYTDLVPCHHWEFGGEGSTIISEFGLVCDRKYLAQVAEMMFLAGVAIGGLVGGIISDKYGRKRTLILCVFTQATLGTTIAFVPWFEMYVVLRALLGFVSVSVVFSGFVLSVELVGGIWRIIAGVCYIFPVSLSYMIVAGIAWFIRDWRNLQLALSLPGFLFVGTWWLLPESPLWLLAMGKSKELLKVIQSAAKTNKMELPSNIDKLILPKNDAVIEEASVLDLFKTAKMRKTTFLLSIIWFDVYLIYYGIVLNMGNIGGDLYINSVISGAVEVPAIAVSILFLLFMGRRWPLSLTLFLAGLACLSIIPVSHVMTNYQWLSTTLTMVGKFSISSSNCVIPIFTAELYPTTIRNIGVGASNVTAGIALLLVPYLWELGRMHDSVPMLVLALSGLIGGIAVLLLPETGNKPLAVTLNEDEESTNNKSCNNTR